MSKSRANVGVVAVKEASVVSAHQQGTCCGVLNLSQYTTKVKCSMPALYVEDKDENKQGRWTGSLAAHDVVEASKYEES